MERFDHDANLAAQTDIRHQMLENGYTPLPNADKRCFLRGWHNIPVTPERVGRWSGSRKFPSTGLRLDNWVAAIDIDVDDRDMIERMERQISKTIPEIDMALIRYGAGDKELWLCRTTEEFGTLHSTMREIPGVSGHHRVEIFGGATARQIGVYGPHSWGDDGEPRVLYEWARDVGPHNVHIDSLPAFDRADFIEMLRAVETCFEEAGWVIKDNTTLGESTGEPIYDLTPDMQFVCNDGVTRTLDDLPEYARDNDPRCSASWKDSAAVDRRRCLVGLDYDEELYVMDCADFTPHKPAESDGGSGRESAFEDIGKHMRDFLEDNPGMETGDFPRSFWECYSDLCGRWAWNGASNKPCCPVYGNEEGGMSIGNLKLTYQQHAFDDGKKKHHPVDYWVAAAKRKTVDGYRFNPTVPQGIYREEGGVWINNYAPPPTVPLPPLDKYEVYRSLWLEYLEHLIPSEREREWLISWMAHKKQNLGVPGVAVIMVARRFGVGRSGFFDILHQVFGERWCRSVSANMLLGFGTQSQYTDYRANSLLATTDEILPEGESNVQMGWRRKKSYEVLKERIDTRSGPVDIIRKNLANYTGKTYTSYMMATNHQNALPLPDNDRRFVVLQNSNTPLMEAPNRLYKRINKVRNPDWNREFIEVVRDFLDCERLDKFDAQIPIKTKAKEIMQSANATDLDVKMQEILEDIDSHDFGWVSLHTFTHRMDVELEASDRDMWRGWKSECANFLRSKWIDIGRDNVGAVEDDKIKKRQLFARDESAHRAFKKLSLDERARMERIMSGDLDIPKAGGG